MKLKLIIKKLKDDPFVKDIPLSHAQYHPDSFIGYFKSQSENKLLGMARIYINKNISEIGDIYIIPKLRGKKFLNNKKLSQILLERIINACQRRKIQKLWLCVTDNNLPAIKRYQQFNFEEVNFTNSQKKQIYTENNWLKNKNIIKMVKYINVNN